jgi:hypothetical protein
MARHVVDATPDAVDELADLFVNAPANLAAAIRVASDRIERKLQYPHLIHSTRYPIEDHPAARRYVDSPLAVVFDVDAANRVVLIISYSMAPPRIALP